MYRKIEDLLGRWVEKKNRKPLVLRGARQVGKSTVVRNFCRDSGINLVEVNLERYPELETVFKSMDPQKIILAIQALPKIKFEKNNLLFFDEIQAIPIAIQALRYFYEDIPELKVIAAGSLLEFVLREHNFSMPVGRIEFLNMFPMDFEEFLMAMEESVLLQRKKEVLKDLVIDPVSHSRLLELQRLYMYVGGMPEAVHTYVETKDLSTVRDVHESILETYRSDFPKYVGSRNISRVQRVFNFAAAKGGEKVKYSNIDGNEQARTLRSDLDILSLAGVHIQIFHSDCSGLPLAAEKDSRVFKLLFLDIGLTCCVQRLTWNAIRELSERQLINEGKLAEQFAAQELVSLSNRNSFPELFYWLREGRSNNAEVDFVIEHQGRVLPIEVKSGKSGTLKSLNQFCIKHKPKTAVRFDLNLPSKQKIAVRDTGKKANSEFDLLNLPLYSVASLFAEE